MLGRWITQTAPHIPTRQSWTSSWDGSPWLATRWSDPGPEATTKRTRIRTTNQAAWAASEGGDGSNCATPAGKDQHDQQGTLSKRAGLWLALRINIVGVGLMALWNTINTLVLSDRVAETVPSALRGSGVGLVSFVGIGLAALIQPIAGRISDRAPLADRRKPFITFGSLATVAALFWFGWAPTFAMLLGAYVALQLATNTVQAAYQGLIPDLVPHAQNGLASGVKNTLTVLGAALGLVGARVLLGEDASAMPVLLLLAGIMGATALLNHLWTPRVEPLPEDEQAHSFREAFALREMLTEFRAALSEQPRFRLAVVAQFLFLLGTYPVQRFLLLFLEERLGVDNVLERAAIVLLLAIALAALAAVLAGELSDHVGRVTVLRWSTSLATVGLFGIALLPGLIATAIAGLCIAIGVGAFQAVNWALLSDDIPQGQGARYFGVANIATAGAGAVAGGFGPLVDVLDAVLPRGTFAVTFSLAAVITALAFWPLHRISHVDAHASASAGAGADAKASA